MDTPVARILRTPCLFSGGAMDGLIDQCLHSVDVMRKGIYVAQRQHTVLPICYARDYPTEILPSRPDVMREVLARKVMTPQEATPMFIQHTALVIAHMYGNLERLCDVALAHQQKDDYSFIIYSVIPALFGYFTSNEHAMIASKFYIRLVKQASVERVTEFLPPFLTSLLMYRFVEAVMSAFVIKFGAAKKQFEDKKKIDLQLVNSFSWQMIRIITESIPLIPEPVVAVFEAMKECGWSDAAFRTMFFGEAFFENMAIRWLNGSPYSMGTYGLKRVLEAVTENPRVQLAMFSRGNVRFEIPSCYEQFQAAYMLYCMTVADVKVATDMVAEMGEVPVVLQDVTYDFLPKQKWYRMFWTKMFPKGKERKKVELRYSPLVFRLQPVKIDTNQDFERNYMKMKDENQFPVTHNEELNKYVNERRYNDAVIESEKFERLMHFRTHASFVQKLLNLVESMDIKLRSSLIIKAAISSRDSADSPELAYDLCAQSTQSTDLRKIQFGVIFGKTVQDQAKRLEREFRTLEDGLSDVLETIQQTFDPSSLNDLPRWKRIQFWQEVEVIQSVENVPMSRQIELLFEIFRAIDAVADNQPQFFSLLEQALVMANGVHVIGRYILFNELIVNHRLFKPLLSERDTTIWWSVGTFIDQFIKQFSPSLYPTVQSIKAALVQPDSTGAPAQ